MNIHTTTKRRLIAIGLEAFDPDLLERWCQEGHLPNIRSLLTRGYWQRLDSTTELSSGTTWSTITTGTNPAKHGMFFFHMQLRPGSYEVRKKYADEVGRDPFWLPLSDSGKRVAVIEVPTARPHKNINGIELVGWGAQAPNWKPSSYPQELLRDVTRRFGSHPLRGWYETKPRDATEVGTFIEKFSAGIRARSAMARWILEQEEWDLFFVVFPEAHSVGHLCWHFLDVNHPEHDPELLKCCGNPVLATYKELDTAIGSLTQEFPDATVLLFSNSGMGPNYSGIHLVPEILQRLGMSSEGVRGTPRAFLSQLLPGRRWGPYAVREIEQILSPQRIQSLKKLFPGKTWDHMTRRFLTSGSGWSAAKAFSLPNDFAGAVRLNVKGREPNGLVDPDIEYERLCKDLTDAFGELTNTSTGRPAVQEIIKVRDVYQGENVDELPDLIVVWRRDAPISSLKSPRIGTVSGILPDRRTGAHTRDGFLLTAGPDIAAARAMKQATIRDIAPTILSLLGEDVPVDMEGQVLVHATAGRTTERAASVYRSVTR